MNFLTATLTGRTGAIKDLEGGVICMGMDARLMREELTSRLTSPDSPS